MKIGTKCCFVSVFFTLAKNLRKNSNRNLTQDGFGESQSLSLTIKFEFRVQVEITACRLDLDYLMGLSVAQYIFTHTIEPERGF